MDLEVRPLRPEELDRADRVLRDAFVAVHGVDLLADTDLLGTRLRARHTTVLAAVRHGRPVGSILVTRWGSIGLLGPLSVDPQLWGRGIGARLLTAAVDLLDASGAGHQGLFTFPASPRHQVLYQRFGFWPRFLTALMSCAVTGSEPRTGTRLSTLDERAGALGTCAEISEAVYAGLDLRGEIDAVLDQSLGDVVLVPDGFAICHSGAGTEAGSGIAYVKFAAARPGPGAAASFAALLEACRGYAAATGAHRLTFGVNTARHQAYRWLLGAGTRVDMVGLTMHRPNAPAYDSAETYVLDDWR
jgi:predicted N-acetyltransferase YhbS